MKAAACAAVAGVLAAALASADAAADTAVTSNVDTLTDTTSSTAADPAARLEALKRSVAEQTRQLEALKRALAGQEAGLESVRRALDEALAVGAPASAPPPSTVEALPTSASATQRGAAQTGAAPAVAPIFEQPGVLTPAGKWAIEPSLQYAYSSSNRIALVGYTIIPALLVGLIDVREVKRNTFTGAITLRHGLTNRVELEAKLPYVSRSDTSVGRAVLEGASSDSTVFDARGHGVGDAEFSARWQLNDGSADTPFYVASLRMKTRTGTDPFEIPVSTTVSGFSGEGVQTKLPTGSGFYGLQPALTVLYPSDPAVFFGSVSYLHTIKRSNVVRPTDKGPEGLGEIAPGGIVGFNFGMGLALNEKASFSIGYDHSAVGRTKQNGKAAADSVRLQLGTLLLGLSYRLSDQRSLNLSLGAGLTRDTPDVALTVRMPTAF